VGTNNYTATNLKAEWASSEPSNATPPGTPQESCVSP